MSQTSTDSDGYEVVKWYTRARRFPQLIGKTPDGASIWGGPYTYTQVIGGAVFLVAGAKTIGLWGHFGSMGNVIVLLAASYGTVLLLGQLPAGARNPLSVAAGLLRACFAPPLGRLAGSPVAARRPHRAHNRVTISGHQPQSTPQPAPAPHLSVPLPEATRSTPALTPVQQMLAGSTSRRP